MSKFLHHLAPHCRYPLPVPLIQPNEQLRKGALCLLAPDILPRPPCSDFLKEDKLPLDCLTGSGAVCCHGCVCVCVYIYIYIHIYTQSAYKLSEDFVTP
jgi:hypothetical protein